MEYGKNPDRQCKGLEKRIRVRYGEVFWIRLKRHGHASGIKKSDVRQKSGKPVLCFEQQAQILGMFDRIDV